MKPPAADNQSEIERRLARRRFCALATPAALAVLLLGTAVTTQARSLATTVLRDAHILAGDSDPALADNHVAHQRRPAGLAGGYAVAGAPGGKAGKPDPFPAGPAAGQQPVAPDSSATAVAPATSSAPTSTTPPVVEEPSTPPVEPAAPVEPVEPVGLGVVIYQHHSAVAQRTRTDAARRTRTRTDAAAQRTRTADGTGTATEIRPGTARRRSC